jgi:WD40 repeat protein
VNDHLAQAGADHQPDPDRIVTPQDFGRELTLLRSQADLTVRQVARAAGLPASTAGDYFSGRHLPAAGQAGALHKILAACGETDPDRVARWTSALGRARRQPGRRALGADAPYRGLASFEAKDAPWFFGREEVTERLAALAAAAPSMASSTEPGAGLPLIVVGPSGSGKSSLLRAGLMPRLTGPARLYVPTARPAADLAALLAQSAPQHVVVDQFEAVFTGACDDEQRQAFIAALGDLARTATVILALRADFYDQALRYPGLAAALQARQVVLGPMTADQVRRAITEPARRANLEVEDGLVELLLRDLAPPSLPGVAPAAHDPGALPLLSHALLSTWEHSSTATITVADYRASGGIPDAIRRTAEDVFGRLTADQQRDARQLFLRLVHVADDAPPARRVVPQAELGGDVTGLLGQFVGERLITVDAGTTQITHDALLVAWPRLRSWIEEDTDDLRARRRITDAARIWHEAGRDSSALPRGGQLAIIQDWAAGQDNRDSLSPQAREFVTAAAAEEGAYQRAERHRTVRLKRLVAALTATIVAVLVLAGYSFQQRASAATARDDADSREVAVEASQLRAQDTPLAAQLSLAAYGIARTPEAASSLLDSSGAPSAAALTDSQGVVESVSLSSGRRLLAAAGADGSLRLWSLARPGHPVPAGAPVAAAPKSALYATAISPDGQVLAAAGAGRTIALWDIADSSRPVPFGRPLSGPGNTVYSVAFSPDGHLLAAGSADGKVWLWDVADPRAPRLMATMGGAAGYVESVAFSPDGHLLAAGSADKTVRLWSVSDPARPAPAAPPLTGPGNVVMSVTFSPDGHTLAAGSQDDKVWLWHLTADRNVRAAGSVSGPTDWVNAVAFSPDGRTLAAGSSDDSVYVWDVATKSVSAHLPQTQPVTSLAWDGSSRLAAADADGTVSVWSLPSPVLMAGAAVNSVAFSPDGRVLAVGSQRLQLWNPVSRQPLAVIAVPDGTFVNSVAFSPSGAVLAAGYGDGLAQLWSRAGKQLGPPVRASASGLTESVAFSPDGRELATGGDDGTVRLWSATGSLRPLGIVRDSGTYVFSVAFRPGSAIVAAASADDDTRLWSVTDPARPQALGVPLTGHTSYALSVAFSPDGRLLAVGSADKTVQLWSVADPARPRVLGAPLTGPVSYVYSVAFSPAGTTLAAGVTDGTVWLWDLADPGHPSLSATLNGPNGHVYTVAFSPSGRMVAAGSADGTVRLWDTSPGSAAAEVCGDDGQPLTQAAWDTYVPGLAYQRPCQ